MLINVIFFQYIFRCENYSTIYEVSIFREHMKTSEKNCSELDDVAYQNNYINQIIKFQSFYCFEFYLHSQIEDTESIYDIKTVEEEIKGFKV